jgi:hypothetical protein
MAIKLRPKYDLADLLKGTCFCRMTAVVREVYVRRKDAPDCAYVLWLRGLCSAPGMYDLETQQHGSHEKHRAK